VFHYFFYLFLGFIIGSIPFGYIVAKLWKNIDIRKFGSGNIGATNVYRVIGGGPAAVVLLLDIGKGVLPLLLVKKIETSPSPFLLILTGIFTVAGHNFSIFLKGRGGKGVATSFGVIITLFPLPAISSFGIWLFITLITKIVSLASIVASFSLPVFVYLYTKNIPFTCFGIIVFLLILFSHRENIKRLVKGKEKKIKFPWERK